MNADAQGHSVSRRDFLKTTATASIAATLEGAALAAEPAGEAKSVKPETKMIGIQVGAVSFVDEGVEQVLDILQSRGEVNTIFLTTFTYGRGLAGRQVPGQPFPDHGAQESDEKFFHGGNFATPHPEFYRNTSLKETRAPDHGNLDILEAVLPKAKKRGLKVFCSCEDAWRSSVPGFAEVAEIDLNGRKTGAQCLFHPDVRHFWTALVTDYARSYD